MNFKETLLAIFLLSLFMLKKLVSAIKFIIENGEQIIIYILLYLLIYSAYLYLTIQDGNLIGFKGEEGKIYLLACRGFEHNVSCNGNVIWGAGGE